MNIAADALISRVWAPARIFTASYQQIDRLLCNPLPVASLSLSNNGGNYGSRRTSLAARRSNPDHHSALALLALSTSHIDLDKNTPPPPWPKLAVEEADGEMPLSPIDKFRAADL
jgi:hypothetical protein